MKTAKRLLAAVLALVMMASMVVVASAEAEVGYYDPTLGNTTVEIVVPAGGTNYLNAYGADGYLATITSIAGLGFQHGEESLTFRVDGQEYPLTLVGDPMMRGMAKVTFTNGNGYDVTVKVAISSNASLATGTSTNPEVIEDLSWFVAEVNQEAGNTEGYFYTCTAPADGEIVAYFGQVPENYECDIFMTNMNTYAQRTLSADGIDNFGMELHMEVKAGHEVQIVIAAIKDAEGNLYPAATMSWCAQFVHPEGSENNPIYLEWNWDAASTNATATVTVAAGETVYYNGYYGMILTVNGVETEQSETGVFCVTNDTAAEATYELALATPVGEYGNPEVIEVLGTYSTDLKEDQSYYYTWTATEDAIVILDITEGANIIAEVQTYVEDSEWPISEQFVLAEPEEDENWNYVGWIVAENLELNVAAGQVLVLGIEALTDWSTWTRPAIEFALTIDVTGTQSNPLDLTYDLAQEGDAQATVTIPAGATYYFTSYGIAGMEMTINGGDATLCAGNPRMPYTWSITNDGAEAAEYVIAVAIPKGSMENPAELETGMNNYAAIAAGSQGYFYTWTAPVAGTLTLEFSAEDAEWNPMAWSYTVNNLTSYVYGDMQDSTNPDVVNPAVITVAAGDELQIVVNTLDPENIWTAPAGDLYVQATFTCNEHGETALEDNYDGTHNILCAACGAITGSEEHTFVDGTCACGAQVPGTESNPIDLTVDLAYEDDYTATVEIPAGTTYYYMSYGIAGMNMSINGGEAILCTGNPRMPYTWSITNDGTETATYVITVAAPVGTMDNPAELVEGENSVELAEGSQGYFYTYTATVAGELTFTISGTNWVYVINNLTSYAYGDTQWSDSDPVMNTATITVAAGDEVQIMVNTYDPANMWTAPAGTVTFTVTLPTEAPAKEGWVLENGNWYFYENGEMVKNAWRKDTKGWVYLGQDGAMLVNSWCKDSKGWCYVGSNGYAVTNCWKKDSKGWVYLDGNGSMVYNKWVKDSKGWCYVDASGYMVYNKWVKDSKGWCHVGAEGYMEYNKWVKDSKGWCYVGSNGYMVINGWAKDSKGWCFMGADGYIVYNDLIVDYSLGKIYYVDASGYMVSDKWIGEGNEWIYFGNDGALAVNKWVKSGGKWYYMGEDGLMLYSCSKKIGNKTYYFNASGVCTNP